MAKIAWSPMPEHPFKNVVKGMIGPLHVATISPSRWQKGYWVVQVHLAPLPDRLDNWTLNNKVSERQAKATAQRVVNAFLKILNGEAS